MPTQAARCRCAPLATLRARHYLCGSARTMRPKVRRIVDMIGSALLGGGVVAAGYELARGGASAGPHGVHITGTAEADGGAERTVATGGDATAPAQAAATTGEESPTDELPPWRRPDASGRYTAFPPIFEEPAPFDEAAAARFDGHGLVTSLAVIVRARADIESPIAGIVRSGTRLRVRLEPAFGGGCKRGWYAIFPSGWICKDAGFAVRKTPPDDAVFHIPAAKTDAPLPYDYWRVKDYVTPFFHRLPSYTEQDRADQAGRAWYEAHGTEPMPTDPSKRPEEVPAVVKEYMNPGYWITRAGEEIHAKRRFLRTLRGSYVRKYQLHQRPAADFRGLVLPTGEELPIYFIRREVALEKREAEGSDVLVKTDETLDRLSTHPFVRKIHIGNKAYYEDENGVLLRAYAVSKAEKIPRPVGLASGDRWIHVDLSEQTLVAYEGDRPVFVTLVSTGKQPGMTPTGVFRIQTKHIATSMRDQPVEEEAYSIEDVPWTQYFHANVALHGAFWHAGFGLVRSHGCVNLSPSDARWLFGFTRPALPPGWHAVTANTLGRDDGTVVYVTD